MPIITQTIKESPFDTTFIETIQALAVDIFGHVDEGYKADIGWRLSRMPDAAVQLAYDNNRLIAFKFGYAMGKLRYHSWLGGVHPEYRRQGIGRRLMVAQHDWARQHEYTSIETGTIKNNESMLRLNLSFGFEIIGTYCRDDSPRVIMQKRL